MRHVDITNEEEAKALGWKIVYGTEIPQTLQWTLVVKAIYDDEFMSIMKTTKRMGVEGGILWQTETEITVKDPTGRLPSGQHPSVSLSQGLTFQPTPAN